MMMVLDAREGGRLYLLSTGILQDNCTNNSLLGYKTNIDIIRGNAMGHSILQNHRTSYATTSSDPDVNDDVISHGVYFRVTGVGSPKRFIAEVDQITGRFVVGKVEVHNCGSTKAPVEYERVTTFSAM